MVYNFIDYATMMRIAQDAVYCIIYIIGVTIDEV